MNMINTGMIRRVDILGRVVVPCGIRKANNLKIKDECSIYLYKKAIVLDFINNIGEVRNFDAVGRITIPAEIRKNLGIKNNDEMKIYAGANKVYLFPAIETDVFGNAIINDEYVEYNGFKISKISAEKLYDILKKEI